MAASPWPVIARERGALADDLSGISDAQWQTPSQCTGWSVHELLAHMLATARMTKGGFLARFAGSGFSSTPDILIADFLAPQLCFCFRHLGRSQSNCP